MIIHNNKSLEVLDEESSKVLDESGQSFIEFLFLLFTLVLFSFMAMKGINSSIANRWEIYVGIVTSPDPDNVQRPTAR